MRGEASGLSRPFGWGEPQGSYRDAIDFGVISTPEMPDIWNLIEYLTQELDEFHAVD